MGKAKGFLGKYGASYFLLSFWLILFLVFTVIPIAISVVMSFTDFDMVRLPRFVGLQNYTTLFLDDDIFIKSLGNTLFYALVTGPAGYLLSFLVAWLLSETSRGVRAVLMLIFYAPTLAGNVYMVWTYIFSGDSYGMLNSLLLRLGLIADPIQWLNDPAYNSIGAVLSISSAFAVGYQNALLTGNPSTDYSTHTVLLHMTDYGYTRFEMGYACAVAVVLFVLMVGTWLVINRGLRRMSSE